MPRFQSTTFCCTLLLAVAVATARRLVGDVGQTAQMQLFVLDAEFGSEPTQVGNLSEPVTPPFSDAIYAGAAIDPVKHVAYGLHASGSTTPSIKHKFTAVDVDTGKVLDVSPSLESEILFLDTSNLALFFDKKWGQIVMTFQRHRVDVLDVYLIDPASWKVSHAGAFSAPVDPGMEFAFIEDLNAYVASGDVHQLMVAANRPLNTTQDVYAGLLIVASLTATGSDSGSGNGNGGYQAHFRAAPFTSNHSIVTDLGCFTGQSASPSVLGFKTILANPVTMQLSRWSLQGTLDDVEPVGESPVIPLVDDTIWASSSPCVADDSLFVLPMDVGNLNNATTLYMFNTTTGALFKSKTKFPYWPSSMLAALE